MRQSDRTRLSTAMVLVLVFGAGTAVGFALDRGTAPASPAVASEREAPDSDEEEPRRRWIIESVDLRPDQRVQVDSILEFYRQRMEELQEEFHEAYRPRSREVVVSTRDALKALLDDRQRVVYDSLLAERNR